MKRYVKKMTRLLVGLVISAVGIVLMLQANIGLDPWNVLHMGLNLVTGISFGVVTIIVGAGAILISMALGERIGVGTICNIVITGFIIDFLLWTALFPQMQNFWAGVAVMLVGQELLSLGTYYYMSAALGTGPRDALMVALSRKTHIPVGICRSATELLAILIGWLLGGKVGLGTVLCALTIGIFFQVNFALLHFDAARLEQEYLEVTLKNWFRRTAR